MSATPARAEARDTLSFNNDWKFQKADAPGAEAPGFDDRAWTTVSAPHTFNDVDTFDNWSLPGHRGEQEQWSGRTWYRKSFILPEAMRGRRVFIEFEGVRQVAEVFINGHRLGISKTGFTPFGFDLTPHVQFGAPNLIAVMCDNRFMKDPLDIANPNLARLSAQVNQAIPDTLDELRADQIPWNNPHWHAAHGGIYRNVRLHVTDPLHITLPLYSFLETAGPYVYATTVSAETAAVTVEVPFINGRPRDHRVTVHVDIVDADGTTVLALDQARDARAGDRATVSLSGTLPRPRIWDPESPHLYRVHCSLRVGGQVVDDTEVPLGIRVVRFDPSTGAWVNGRPVKLRGWGQKPTNEWPGLGAALPDWLHFHTLRLMKDAGANFVRWGHTAAGPSLIDAGDRLGLIADQPGVDGEHDTVGGAWALRASAFRDTIVYFRNNPSILIWEGGNQKVSREHARELRGYMDTWDPHGGRAYAHRRADQVTAEFMDVGIGTEGGREIGTLPVVEGEYNREESPRRVWDDASPPNFGYPEARGQTYQLTSEQFAANQVAQFVKKLGAPEHSGGANWIFSDSTSGGRVAVEVARASGEVDGVRLPKEAYFACAVVFSAEPRVHIIGHWSYPAGTTKPVHVVAHGDEVELFVNGVSRGRATPTDRFLFTFRDVAWEPGEVKAVAYRDGRPLAEQVKRTAGTPVALRVTPLVGPGGLRADGADVALFDVEAVDARGERCPTVQARVDFTVSGPATWRGGYNSGRVDSINHRFLDLESGINRVAVRATRVPGPITVRAETAGLKPAAATITSTAFEATGGLSPRLPATPPVALPRVPVTFVGSPAGTAPGATVVRSAGRVAPGRFIAAFDYSGPSAAIVHVETRAANGRNAYVDRDSPFSDLPPMLVGADWVQAAARDASYSAVDLIELTPAAGSVVTVAWDAALPPPRWLGERFDRTSTRLVVNGRAMTLFTRLAPAGESLTLGGNTDAMPPPAEANMYLVFVHAPTRSPGRR
jgi:beta-galactosidase